MEGCCCYWYVRLFGVLVAGVGGLLGMRGDFGICEVDSADLADGCVR